MMTWEKPITYAVKHKDCDVVAASRSGGIFTALSDEVLENGGVVYGCVLTEGRYASHVRAESKEERNRMRGSKYIQSDLKETFQMVKQDLDAGRRVLFSGTSCQVAGLRGYLRKDFESLLCVDIVCHGVPSPKVWNAYLDWLEKKHHAKVVNADFRNKKEFGWRAHVETIYFEDGQSFYGEIFKKLFINKHTMLRPSCHKCPYKSIIHPGDITIADYWGIQKIAKEFNDNKGVSLVLINNPSGEHAFESVKEKLQYKQTRIEDSMQRALKSPYEKPDNREEFWDDFSKKSFRRIAVKYADYGKWNELKAKREERKKNGSKSFKTKIKKLLKKIKRKVKKLFK